MILLTGASGFIGSHLLKRLTALYGHDQVLALTSKPIPYSKYLLHNDYKFDESFSDNNDWQSIKTVIHAGAFTPKNGIEANDWKRCDENIINTHNLLQALPVSIQKVIFTSTLDVYGETEIISETSPVFPVSLYGDSKLYCEKMIGAWAAGNKKIAQILRIGHVYGPGEEKYQKIIPNTIKNIIADAPLQIAGEGRDIRTFIYISDVVEAVVNSIKLTADMGPINIAGKEAISIKDLVITIQKIAGSTKNIDYVASDRKVRNLYFDNSKMSTLLGKEKNDLLTGLAEEWEYMLSS